MKRSSYAIAGAVALILTAFWWSGVFGGYVDPKVRELESMGRQMMGNGGPPSEENRRAFGEQMRSLTDVQRRQFYERNRPEFMRRLSERMDAFFALSPEEQRKKLDDRIDAMIARRDTRRQQAASAGTNSGEISSRGHGRGRFSSMTEDQRDTRRKKRLDRTDPKLRAQFAQLREMLNERLKERGEPPIDHPGRFFRFARPPRSPGA